MLSSQSTTLILAGAETTSTALCRILHLLALHPMAQDRLRQEIVDVQALATRAEEDSGPSLDYDTLMTLPFLDAVCKETLRLSVCMPACGVVVITDLSIGP